MSGERLGGLNIPGGKPGSEGYIYTPGERLGSEEIYIPGRVIYVPSEAQLGGSNIPGGKPGPEDFVYL